jgi:hypothetical protein
MLQKCVAKICGKKLGKNVIKCPKWQKCGKFVAKKLGKNVINVKNGGILCHIAANLGDL